MPTVTMIGAALEYVARGWAVIPVYGGSKRPIEGNWPNRLARTAEDVQQFWAWYPSANIGIATGASSGLWVLDVDPDNGGDIALAQLIAQHGELPVTFTVKTGGGGLHYYFAMPDFEPRNQQNGGSLPDGLDVRGWHGQVVAPPSVSEKGAYSLLCGVPELAPAPGWLLELIRPRAIPERPDPSPMVGELGGGSPGERGPAYAARAVQQLVESFAAMTVGGRNAAAFRTAARLLELANAPWSGIPADRARALFDWACTQNGLDVDSPAGQPERAWRQAERRVGAQGAELPPSTMYGAAVDFSGWPQAAQDFSAPATVTVTAEGAPALQLPDAGAWMGPSAPAPPTMIDQVELAIRQRLASLQIDREARRRLLGGTVRNWGQLGMDDAAIEDLGDLVPVVADWLWLDTLARIFGPSGHGKSFVVLDVALCVAHGMAWHGLSVAGGAVSYVAGEGVRGLKRRRRAWLTQHGLTAVDDGFKLYPDMPSLLDDQDWSAFVAEQVRRRVTLIIFDTQAHLTAGLSENDKEGSDVLVQRLIELRKATGACVLLVHHTGKDESAGGRGHSSVKGALDTEIEVRLSGKTVTVTSRKQKDAADPPPRLASMVPVPGTQSLVLVYAGDPGTADSSSVAEVPPSTKDRASWTARRVAEVLIAETSQGNGVTLAELKAAWRAQEANHSVPRDTADRQVTRAVARLDELSRIGQGESASKMVWLWCGGLDPLEPHPEGPPAGFGRRHATKEDQRDSAIQGGRKAAQPVIAQSLPASDSRTDSRIPGG